MARRRATKKYESIFDFVTDYTTSLSNATINLLPGSYRGELANEIKLDLSIPEFGRIGPIVAQVIFRDPSGLVALRLPQVPPEVLETYQKAKQHCNDLVQPYVEAGLVVHKEEHDATLASMQKQLEDQKKEFEQKLADAIAQLKAESEAKLEELREELEAQRAAIPEKTTERGIPIVDFSQLAPLANGAMHQFDTFLIEAAKQQWTGLLYIDQGSQRRFAYLDQGAIVAWRSDPLIEKEVLGILLYSFKQITEEQLKQSLQLMEEKNIRQGEALVELGVMGFPQMVVVLSKQVEYIFQQVRKQKKGTYSFYETALPERFLSNKLFFINIRIRELRKKAKSLSANMLFRNLSGSLGKKVYLEKDMIPVLRTGAFSAAERKTLQLIQSQPRMLRDLLKISPIAKTDINVFFWLIQELEGIHFGTSKSHKTEQKEVQNIDPQILLHQKIQEIERGTYFDVLGLHWIIVGSDVEKAYARQKSEIQVFKGMPEFSMISSSLEEAYENLKDVEERRSYRARLFHKKFLSQAAMQLAVHGEKAIQKKNKVLACSCFAKAIELCPNESSYKDGLKRAALA